MAKNKEFIYNKTRELGMLNGSSVNATFVNGVKQKTGK